jgi:hypothetical protein
MTLKSIAIASVALASLSAAGCSTSSTPGSAPMPVPGMSASPPTPDPRIGLRAGWMNAGEASWNLEVVSKTPPSEKFINLSTPGDRRLLNSDIAFFRNYAIEGNFSGYQVWDISNPRKPRLHTAYVCPGSQSDVSVYRNLMFVSSEATNARLDCGMQGVMDTVSKERARGIRIFDITDIANPKYLATVQTCRGSHTHTIVPDLKDNANIYVYVSGASRIRSPSELEGCSAKLPEEDPNSALFRIEVIQVPLAHPDQAKIVSSPRIFENLPVVQRHGESAADSAKLAAQRAAAAEAAKKDTAASKSSYAIEDTAALRARGPTQCHDITVYSAIGLAGGACAGYGLLLDIRDVANPKRVAAVADPNFSYWHSATFNNDGTKILFSDEWGGGLQPRCRPTDKPEWGADAIFTLANNKMTFMSYYKLPVPQTEFENCVAHNGSLIPVPGRDIMAQAWYQGGVSVFDFTDPAHPKEIAFFDRGPMDSTKLVDGGYWSSYWYNGYIFASELSRGLDIFKLKPSAFLSQNEIDAAESVRFEYLNVQNQPKFVWPASFAVARAYLDQLVRNNGISPERSTAIARELDRAEKTSGVERRDALAQLVSGLERDAQGAPDAARVRLMTTVVKELTNLQSGTRASTR